MPTTEISLDQILNQLRADAPSEREKGDRLERLMLAYFKTEPLYRERFSQVWLWMDWPGRYGQPDTGIDLVAEEAATGDYCAIQCKFYDPKATLDKQDIDSFFTASGKAEFSSRIIVSTTDYWSKHAETALKNQRTPVTRLRVRDLAASAINWGDVDPQRLEAMPLKAKKTPRPHQRDAVNGVIAGFQTTDRGKLIMACGTGKTYTSLF